MKSPLFLLLLLFAAVGCSAPASPEKPADTLATVQKVADPEPFFDYDAIDYYAIAEDKADVHGVMKKQSASAIDSVKYDVLLGFTPETLADTTFIVLLEKMGFVKSTLDTGMFDAMNKLFIPKKAKNTVAYDCIAIYRDLLVFRKKGRVSGVAKICFSCKQNQLTGAIGNTSDFGQDGDYDRLKRLLHK